VRFVIALSVIALSGRVQALSQLSANAMCGSDFPVFYRAGQLVGSPSLYSWNEIQKFEHATLPCSSDYAVFIRLPYFAVLMKPWTQLPFWPAFSFWRLALVLAAGVFICLWPGGGRAWAFIACALSLPLHYAITNGQDDPFLLLWLALAAACWKKGWDFVAGCALAMCAEKFHLFLLLPVFLFYRRQMLAGFLTASTAILAICFIAGGWNWPRDFLQAIHHNIDPDAVVPPTVWGLAHSHLSLMVLLGMPVAAAALYVIHRGDFVYGISAVISGGILLAKHIVSSDCALFIPIALALVVHPMSRYSKWAAIALATPLAYIASGEVVALAAILLLGLMTQEVWSLREPGVLAFETLAEASSR
jgi:hypothetical protein